MRCNEFMRPFSRFLRRGGWRARSHLLSVIPIAAAILTANPAAAEFPGAPQASSTHTSRSLPAVASINLCTDQLVLQLADREQIRTLSWLSANPEESMGAEQAARFPLNYGSAEEILRFDPDVVLAGTLTSNFTRTLLERLGYRVVEITPPDSIDDIALNVTRVADAVGQVARGAAVVKALLDRRDRLQSAAAGPRITALVIRPGGFTVGRHSLVNEYMKLAGLRNVAADGNLDRWGSLSIETLLRSQPELLILTDYHRADASLANQIFQHPALKRVEARTPTQEIPAADWACGLPQSLDTVVTMRRAAVNLRNRKWSE